MGSIARFNLSKIKFDFGIDQFVETGTGQGKSIELVLKSSIATIFSCESHPQIYDTAKKKFTNESRVQLDSRASKFFLTEICKKQSPMLFFLDAHYGGGTDGGFSTYSDALKNFNSETNFPLSEEIEIIAQKNGVENDVIIIDDARIFVDENFQLGACPEEAKAPLTCRGPLEIAFSKLKNSHQCILLHQDHGYWIFVPQHYSISKIKEWVHVLPHDTSNLTVSHGFFGMTGISMQRRIRTPQFLNRYFVGKGIDVGGGRDSLALYAEYFPKLENVVVYDQELGDAQLLDNVPDDSFDFLYSSHCLEHLRDPYVAISNWIRVVKPGGCLVVSIPDEDLYEQGFWPSRFNSDHKLTFTIMKEKSWSPVSVNVLEIVHRFHKVAECLTLELIDEGYRFALANKGFDQTSTPVAESSIEFILRKRPL